MYSPGLCRDVGNGEHGCSGEGTLPARRGTAIIVCRILLCQASSRSAVATDRVDRRLLQTRVAQTREYIDDGQVNRKSPLSHMRIRMYRERMDMRLTVCLSVCPSVCPSVRPSDRPSVRVGIRITQSITRKS